MKKISLAIVLIIICSPAFADTIYLKNGEQVEGKIIEETEDFVRIELDIKLTYFADQIERIERESKISEETKAYLESLKNIKVSQEKMQEKEALPAREEIQYQPEEAVDEIPDMNNLAIPRGMGLEQFGQLGPQEMEMAKEITDALFSGDDEKIAQMGIDPQMLKKQLESGPSGNAYKQIMRKFKGQTGETQR
ncbi:MAG: hypothetical protein KKC42_02455 [Candidatus Omnitrophica bacterium]|nr:hypothetical protein [Candidatus Omnitrophota bacterium]MBU1905905.1 hypothetical protein [Candidatus Omnitrophota bacterium]